ncbi:MAG: hypothetical protein GOU99_00420 [Candidatus Altiarchaeota archaeon]|nr:hypothetical protein [Candidatus Altiarchaeota archaeon]
MAETQQYLEIAAEKLEKYYSRDKKSKLAASKDFLFISDGDKITTYQFPIKDDLNKIPEADNKIVSNDRYAETVEITDKGLDMYVTKTVATGVWEWQRELFEQGEHEPKQYVASAAQELADSLGDSELSVLGRGEKLYVGDTKGMVVIWLPEKPVLHRLSEEPHVYPDANNPWKISETEYNNKWLKKLAERHEETPEEFVQLIRSVGEKHLSEFQRQRFSTVSDEDGEMLAYGIQSTLESNESQLSAEYNDGFLTIREAAKLGKLSYRICGDYLILDEKQSVGTLGIVEELMSITGTDEIHLKWKYGQRIQEIVISPNRKNKYAGWRSYQNIRIPAMNALIEPFTQILEKEISDYMSA